MIRLRQIALLLLSFLLLSPGAHAAQKAAYRHYLKALLLANQRNFVEALKEYEAAITLDPESVFMYEQAADLALETGQMDRARDLAERFADLSPKNGKAYYLLGNVRWASGDLAGAKAAFEKTLELSPDFSEALYAMGNLLSSQSPQEAKSYLKNYLLRNPDNASDAEFQIAVIEQRSGEEESAERHLRSAIELDRDNMHAHYALAQMYEVRRDTAAALKVYAVILERDRRNIALLNHVGEMHYLNDDAVQAREHFERAKALLPDNPTTNMWLALLAEQEGDFKTAAARIRESAALTEEAPLNLRLSYYLTQDGRLKEAVEVLEKAHALWPDNEEISYFLALGYDDLKMPRKAVVLMTEVLKHRPDHRDARFQLGALYEKLDDIVEAEKQFREILKAHPDDASALNFLGYSFADRNIKLDEAEALIRRAVELKPANGAYVDSLGWVQYRKGNVQESLATLLKAVEILPYDDAVWAHVGEIQEALGRKKEAWRSWKKAQRFEPKKKEYASHVLDLEKDVPSDELGRRYQGLILEGLGQVASFGGLSSIEGKIGGQNFSFHGILHYKAPLDLRVDVLGPLFVPIFGLGVKGPDGFEMDPLNLKGVPQELVEEYLFGAIRMIRDFFEGSSLRDENVQFHKGWRRSRIETSTATLYLNKSRMQVLSVKSKSEPELQLGLSEYRPVKGHALPARLTVQGKGFSLEFRLSGVNAVFEPDVQK